MDSRMVGVPDQCAYSNSKSGWMEGYIFESWFSEVFLRQLEDKRKPIIVFFDEHGSHLTYQTALPVNKEAVPKAKLLPSTTLISSVEQTATVSSTSASESEQQMTQHKAMR